MNKADVTTRHIIQALVAAGAIALGGCAAPTAEDVADAPTVEGAGTSDQAIIYSTNTDGTWSANAIAPEYETWISRVTGSATFTGPSGKTRKMGMCLLREYRNGSGVMTACSTTADCGASPTTLPTGGSRYCTNFNNAGTKYCFYRPGAQTTYCAGSPALGGAAVSPGTYSKGVSATDAYWISYGCFEGCTSIDPSSSSAAGTINECQHC